MTDRAEPERVHRARRAWPRRALVGLWMMVFLLAGLGLFSRWDSFVSRLSRPPVDAPAVESARR